MSTRWTDRQNVAHQWSEVLLSYRKQWSPDTCYNMSGPRKHAKSPEFTYLGLHFCELSRIPSTFVETGVGLWLPGTPAKGHSWSVKGVRLDQGSAWLHSQYSFLISILLLWRSRNVFLKAMCSRHRSWDFPCGPWLPVVLLLLDSPFFLPFFKKTFLIKLRFLVAEIFQNICQWLVYPCFWRVWVGGRVRCLFWKPNADL